MGDNRLDLNAPLLSVRRFTQPAAKKAPLRRSSLPFYNPDFNSAPLREPGLVPFLWEQTPGLPKPPEADLPVAPPPKLPLGRISNEQESDAYSSERRKMESSGSYKASEDGDERRGQLIPGDGLDGVEASSDRGSSTGSLFLNCSTSGSTDATDTVGIDPEVRDFMMGRFLSAAEAMAVEVELRQSSPRKLPIAATREPAQLPEKTCLELLLVPYRHRPNSIDQEEEVGPRYDDDEEAVAVQLTQSSSRKLPIVVTREPARLPEKTYQRNCLELLPVSYRHRPNSIDQEEEVGPHYDDDDNEEDYNDASHFPSKSCGLIPQFWLKSSSCLFNPVSGVNFQSRQPPYAGHKLRPHIKTLHYGSLDRAENENSWEAVYSYKLGCENHSQGEERSKLTSESNRLTCWSDSQTHEGSSSFRHSNGGVTPPCRNDTPRPHFNEERVFLGVEKKESAGRRGGRQRNSGSTSPAIGRTLLVDSAHMLYSPKSKLSSVNATTDTTGMMDLAVVDSEAVVDSQKMEQSLLPDSFETNAVQPKFSKAVDPNLSSFLGRSICEEMDGNDVRKSDIYDESLPLKVGDLTKSDASLSLCLLPPPLPKSPSESWLSRTLLSVSSKNPPPKSLIGVRLHSRKHSFNACSTILKDETNIKPSKLNSRSMRFVEVIGKPTSLHSAT